MAVQTAEITFDAKRCVAHDVRQYIGAGMRPNAYWCPRGKKPGRAWVLMLQQDLQPIIDAPDTARELVFTAGKRVAFPGMYYRHCTRVSFAHENNTTSAAYLVEIVDRRWLLNLSSINAQYNVRCGSPPGTSGADLYYDDTLNSGSVWTWATMVANMWAALPAGVAGAAPSLPYTPGGTPDGWQFIGVNAWDALHTVLEKIGCTTVFNPVTAAFAIVRNGAVQAGYADAIAANARYMDTAVPYRSAAPDAPATIRVFFNRFDEDHGVEKDTLEGTGTLLSTMVQSKDYATGIAGAVSGTVLPLWDDLSAVYVNGSITNDSDLTTRANARGAEWVNTRTQRARHRRRYQGVIDDFTPGSQVAAVYWANQGNGFTTEVVNHESEPTEPYVHDGSGHADDDVVAGAERLTPPNIGRPQFPVNPRVGQPVQVYHSSGTQGDFVSANGDGLHPGFVIRWSAGTASQLEACWVRLIDLAAGSTKTVDGEYLVGRLCGRETSGGTTLPVYVARSNVFLLSADSGTDQLIKGGDTLEVTGGNAIGTVASATDTVTINHDDTSSVSNVSETSGTHLSGITFDTYGHVQSIDTGTHVVEYDWVARGDTGAGDLTVTNGYILDFEGGKGIDTTTAANKITFVFDLTELDEYDGGKTQVLGHVSGTVKLIDTESC